MAAFTILKDYERCEKVIYQVLIKEMSVEPRTGSGSDTRDDVVHTMIDMSTATQRTTT